MKKFIQIIFLVAFVTAIQAQNINLHMKDKSVVTKTIAEIDSITFTTETIPDNNVTDSDGNTYSIVTIGTQTWMAENLATTKYNDGTSIPLVTDNTAWANLSTSGYCWYNNDKATNGDTYGALYNWHTVNTDKLCPTGWHVPTDAEWTEFEDYLIANGYNWDGSTSGNKTAKSLAATSGWTSSSTTGVVGNDQSSNNSTGFTAFPGGVRLDDDGSFYYLGDGGYWWSATESYSSSAYYRRLYYGVADLGRIGNGKKYGFWLGVFKTNERSEY